MAFRNYRSTKERADFYADFESEYKGGYTEAAVAVSTLPRNERPEICYAVAFFDPKGNQAYICWEKGGRMGLSPVDLNDEPTAVEDFCQRESFTFGARRNTLELLAEIKQMDSGGVVEPKKQAATSRPSLGNRPDYSTWTESQKRRKIPGYYSGMDLNGR